MGESTSQAKEPARAVKTSQESPEQIYEKKWTELTQKLDTAVREQYESIRQRRFEIIRRHDMLMQNMKDQKSSEKFKKEWTEITMEFGKKDKTLALTADERNDYHVALEAILRRWEKNIPQQHIDYQYRLQHNKDWEVKYQLYLEHKELLMTLPDGRVLGLFPEEKKKNTALTEEQYLRKIAHHLRTPERIAFFLQYFWKYTYDSHDPNDPFKKASSLSPIDIIQTPEETLNRVEGDQMLGDCEDASIFSQLLLWYLGEHSFVLKMPGHSTCVLLRQDEAGYHHAFTFCTFGLDHNGYPFGKTLDDTSTTSAASFSGSTKNRMRGYDDPHTALNAVINKFKRNRMLKVHTENWNADNGFEVFQRTNKRDNNNRVVYEVIWKTANDLASYVNYAPAQNHRLTQK